MRRADVRKLLENVGVRFQSAGRAFAFGEKRQAIIDHVVSEHAAVAKRWRVDVKSSSEADARSGAARAAAMERVLPW